MSDVAVTWAKAQDCPTRPSKPLLAFLASYANAAGEGWAAVEVLAIELQCDARSVRRGLAELRAAKLLEDTGKWEVWEGKRYPIFRLPLERGFANTAQKLRAMRAAAADLTRASGQGRASPDASVSPTEGGNDTTVRSRPDSAVTQIGKGKGNGCSDEHPASVRADDVFNEAFGLYEGRGQGRTHVPCARRLFAPVLAEVGPVAAVAMVRRYVAEDRDLRSGDYGAPAFETWLESERWRRYLPKATEAAVTRTPFVGPPEVLEAIVSAIGGTSAQAFLDGATFREADRTVLTRTSVAATRLADELGWSRCKSLDLRFERAAAPATAPGVNA